MKNVKIRESLGVGWSLFMKRPWYLLGLSVAVFLLISLLGSNTVIAALSAIVYAGYIAVMLRFSRGETINFDDLFTIDQRWIYFAFLFVIKSFLILLGLLCFIVPGVYLSVRWMFAEILVVDKGMKPLEALRASSALTQGHRWKLFLFSVVVSLLMVVGLVFLLVGVVVAVIVAFFAKLHIYQSLQASEVAIENQN